MNNELTYEQAYKELEQIVKKIEQGNTSIDTLADNLKRANELITICRNKLHKAEEDIKAIEQNNKS